MTKCTNINLRHFEERSCSGSSLLRRRNFLIRIYKINWQGYHYSAWPCFEVVETMYRQLLYSFLFCSLYFITSYSDAVIPIKEKVRECYFYEDSSSCISNGSIEFHESAFGGTSGRSFYNLFRSCSYISDCEVVRIFENIIRVKDWTFEMNIWHFE